MKPGRAIALGTGLVAVLDGLDAILFFGLLRGVSPMRIFQGIAAGLLGRDAAVQGGLATAGLGLLLHVFIAACVVTTYFAASRMLPWLRRRWILSGLVYGLIVYTVMNFVVIPLSAAPQGVRTSAAVINGVAIHLLGVGLPAAWATRLTCGDR